MAIRIEHQPSVGAVGMAAFATGLGRREERRRKYALDMWQFQQRMQAYGSRYGAGRRAAAAQPAGRVTDPLADDPGLTSEKRAALRGQRRARARAARMGLPIAAGEQPQFTSQAQIEQQQERDWELADKERERLQKVRDDKLQRAQELADKERQWGLESERDRDAEIENDLQTGKLILDDKAKKQIRALDEQLQKDRKKFTDEEWEENLADYEKEVRQIKRWGARLPEKDERPLGEQFPEDTWEAPDGTILQKAPDGKWEVLIPAPEDSAAVAAKEQEDWRIKEENRLWKEKQDDGDLYEGDVKTRDDARRIAKENWETEQESRRMIREEGKPKAQPQSEPPTEIGIDGVPLPPGESEEPQAGPGGVQPPEKPEPKPPRAADVMGWLDEELEREGVAPPPGPPPADKPKLEVTPEPAPDLVRRKGQMAEPKRVAPPPRLTTYEQIDALEPGAVFRWRNETTLRRKRRTR